MEPIIREKSGHVTLSFKTRREVQANKVIIRQKYQNNSWEIRHYSNRSKLTEKIDSKFFECFKVYKYVSPIYKRPAFRPH